MASRVVLALLVLSVVAVSAKMRHFQRRLDASEAKMFATMNSGYPEVGHSFVREQPHPRLIKQGSTGEKDVVAPNRPEGYYDPHNHYTGILDWRSIGLTLKNFKYDDTASDATTRKKGADNLLKAALQKVLDDANFKAAVAWAKQALNNEFDIIDPTIPELYVAQWLSSGYIAGVQVDQVIKDPDAAVAYLELYNNGKMPDKLKKPSEVKAAFDGAKAALDTFKKALIEEIQYLLIGYHKTVKTDTNKDTNSLLGSAPRTAHGSWTHLGLLNCIATFKLAANHGDLENMMEQTFTASPLLDFDTSYVMRGLMDDKGTSSDDGIKFYAQLVIQQLVDSNTRYVEISQPIGKVPFPEEAFTDATGPLAKTIGKKKKLSTLIYGEFNKDNVKSRIRVRWLPMYLGRVFAAGTDPLQKEPGVWFQTDDDGKTEFQKENPRNLDTDAGVAKMLEYDHVVGVDYASPEVLAYQSTGLGHDTFVDHALMLAKVAQAKNKHLVMHIHCGEGYPMYNYGDYLKKEVAAKFTNDKLHDGPTLFAAIIADKDFGVPDTFCVNAKKKYGDIEALTVKTMKMKAATTPATPVHYITGRNNIEAMIVNLESIPKEAKLKDVQEVLMGKGGSAANRRVLFRLGHATHMTYAQAKRMRNPAIDLMVDTNFESNLATSALLWNSPPVTRPLLSSLSQSVHIDLNSMGFDIMQSPRSNLKQTTDAGVEMFFRGHGFLNAFAAGVHILIGSDGAGTEHSNIIDGYMIAEALLNLFKKACIDKKEGFGHLVNCAEFAADKDSPIAKKPDLVKVDTLLHFQHAYSQYMQTGPDPLGAVKLAKPWG